MLDSLSLRLGAAADMAVITRLMTLASLSNNKDSQELCKFSAFAGASAATTVRVDVLGELPTFIKSASA